MNFRPAVFGLLICCASSLRKAGRSAVNVESIACPVLAALVKNRIVKEDQYGRVSQNDTTIGLQATGNSYWMALFQSKGIAGFGDTDYWQNVRIKFSKDTDRWLNYFTMNAQDTCRKNGPPKLPNGRVCNANIPFQQHGYSTRLRDPDGGSTGQKRFDNWFGKPGVLKRKLFVGNVMTLEGLGKLLAYARAEGDFSGEFALNDDKTFGGSTLEEYHPSITSPLNQSAVSTWQAVTAWSSFWAAFAHERRGEVYMKESDLRTFFIDGNFPEGWVMKPWGFRETFATVAALEGSGAGDAWSGIIRDVLDKYGRDADERVYFEQMIASIGLIGAREDDLYKSYPKDYMSR